jgi:hypothetical protein
MPILLDNSLAIGYTIHKLTKGGDTVEAKGWTIRMPVDVLNWIRQRAAQETIKQNRNVSMNAVAVEILTKAMQQDQKKGGR